MCYFLTYSILIMTEYPISDYLPFIYLAGVATVNDDEPEDDPTTERTPNQ
jgi:hypothetical protein